MGIPPACISDRRTVGGDQNLRAAMTAVYKGAGHEKVSQDMARGTLIKNQMVGSFQRISHIHGTALYM